MYIIISSLGIRESDHEYDIPFTPLTIIMECSKLLSRFWPFSAFLLATLPAFSRTLLASPLRLDEVQTRNA